MTKILYSFQVHDNSDLPSGIISKIIASRNYSEYNECSTVCLNYLNKRLKVLNDASPFKTTNPRFQIFFEKNQFLENEIDSRWEADEITKIYICDSLNQDAKPVYEVRIFFTLDPAEAIFYVNAPTTLQ